jgi:hypothetical protein
MSNLIEVLQSTATVIAVAITPNCNSTLHDSVASLFGNVTIVSLADRKFRCGAGALVNETKWCPMDVCTNSGGVSSVRPQFESLLLPLLVRQLDLDVIIYRSMRGRKRGSDVVSENRPLTGTCCFSFVAHVSRRFPVLESN